MKIGQQPDIPPAPAQSGPVKAGQASAPAARNERKTPGVGVTVSEQARALEQTRAADAPEVDMAKVEAVRQQIDKASYIVNPETIADRLLANAREMLSRTGS